MEGIKINHRLSKDYLLNDSKDSNIKVEITLDVNHEATSSKPMHYCVLLDASGSMYYAIRDEEIKTVEGRGSVNIESVSSSAVVADSTIYLATRALNNIINRLGANDTLTLITYNEEARVIFERYSKENKVEMIEKINSIPELYREEINKYTNMSNSLKLGNEILSKYPNDNKKIIFITDGRPSFNINKNGRPVDTKNNALRESMMIAKNQIAMDCIGLDCIKYTNPKNIENLNRTEQLDFTFLEELSSTSNGNVYLVKSEAECNYELEQVMQKSKDSCVPSAELFLQFSEEVSVKEYYMIEPQIKYYGKLKLDGRRIGFINLNEIDSKKSYKFLFDLDVSKENIKNDTNLNIMALKTKYALNNNGNIQQLETQADVVEIKIGSDIVESQKFNGRIENDYELATIKKYERNYQEAYAKNDTDGVISNIKKIIDIYESQGYGEEANISRDLLNKFKQWGKISQSDINKSGHASTTMKKGQRTVRKGPNTRSKIRATAIRAAASR